MSALDSTPGLRRFVLIAVVGVATLPSMSAPGVRAQTPAVKFDVQAAKGLVVSPVYEGWYAVDGRKYALFGYPTGTSRKSSTFPLVPTTAWRPARRIRGSRRASFPACTTASSRQPSQRSADDRGDLDPHGQRADAVDSGLWTPST